MMKYRYLLILGLLWGRVGAQDIWNYSTIPPQGPANSVPCNPTNASATWTTCTWPPSVGSVAFSGVTGGTNTANLIMGNSGSLTPTGTGVINATPTQPGELGIASVQDVAYLTGGTPIPCNGASDQSASVDALINAGYTKIRLPANCVYYPHVPITFTASVGGATSGTMTPASALLIGDANPITNGNANGQGVAPLTQPFTFSNGVTKNVTINGQSVTWTGALAAGTITTATVASTVPGNTIFYGDGPTSTFIATPVTGDINAGPNSEVHNVGTINSFCSNSTQPQSFAHICTTQGFKNNSTTTILSLFHSWPGENTGKIGPQILGPKRQINITGGGPGGGVGNQTTGTVTSPNPLPSNIQYSLTFSDGQQRLGALSGSTMTWATALNNATILTAAVDDVAFTASVGNSTTGTFTDCHQTAPGNMQYWSLVFDEGSGVTEERTQVSITDASSAGSGACAAGTGGQWTINDSAGALAARTIYGAGVEMTDGVQQSFDNTGTGDNVYFGCNPVVNGQENCSRWVIDASGSTVTGANTSNSTGLYMFLGKNSMNYQHRGIFIKDYNDGSQGGVTTQIAEYIQRLGSASAAIGTSITIDDISANYTAGAKPYMSWTANNQATGNLFDINGGTAGTVTYMGNVIDVSMNQDKTAPFTGSFLNFVNYVNSATTTVFNVDNAGNATMAGLLSFTGADGAGNVLWDCNNATGANIFTLGICWQGTASTVSDTGTGAATSEVMFRIPTVTLNSSTLASVNRLDEMYIPAPLSSGSVTPSHFVSLETGGDIYDAGAFTSLLGGSWGSGTNTQTIGINTGTGVAQTNINTGAGNTASVNIGNSGGLNLKGTSINLNTTTTGIVHIADGGSTSNIDIGSGSNIVNMGPMVSQGTAFTVTVSGCSGTSGTPTVVAGAQAGAFTGNSTGTGCVFVISPDAGGVTAPNAWVCSVTDMTAGVVEPQTAKSSTTCTVTAANNLATGHVFLVLATGY